MLRKFNYWVVDIIDYLEKFSLEIVKMARLNNHEFQFENLPISSSSQENNVNDFTLKYLSRFELCALEIYEKFVYKHSETIESGKN